MYDSVTPDWQHYCEKLVYIPCTELKSKDVSPNVAQV